MKSFERLKKIDEMLETDIVHEYIVEQIQKTDIEYVIWMTTQATSFRFYLYEEYNMKPSNDNEDGVIEKMISNWLRGFLIAKDAENFDLERIKNEYKPIFNKDVYTSIDRDTGKRKVLYEAGATENKEIKKIIDELEKEKPSVTDEIEEEIREKINNGMWINYIREKDRDIIEEISKEAGIFAGDSAISLNLPEDKADDFITLVTVELVAAWYRGYIAGKRLAINFWYKTS